MQNKKITGLHNNNGSLTILLCYGKINYFYKNKLEKNNRNNKFKISKCLFRWSSDMIKWMIKGICLHNAAGKIYSTEIDDF